MSSIQSLFKRKAEENLAKAKEQQQKKRKGGKNGKAEAYDAFKATFS